MRGVCEFDAFGGLTTQAGCARLTIERLTKFTSSGDSGTPLTAPRWTATLKPLTAATLQAQINARAFLLQAGVLAAGRAR